MELIRSDLKELSLSRMSFPQVLSGNPDCAAWTPDKDIPEKRIRGKSGVTGAFEMSSGNEFDNPPDHYHTRLNPEPLFSTFRCSFLTDKAPSSFPHLDVQLKSVTTPACLPPLPSLHMRYGWQALRQTGRNVPTHRSATARRCATLSPTLRFGELVSVQARRN